MSHATLSAEDLSFAKGCLSLHLQLMVIDANPPRGVQVDLAEDGRTVLLLAEDGQGHFVGSSFTLDGVTTEEAFHNRAQHIRGMLEPSVDDRGGVSSKFQQ